MADGGDNRDRRFKNGPRDHLLVESPQIFQAASASSQQNQVELRTCSPGVRPGDPTDGPLIEQSNGAGNFLGSPCPLHAAGSDDDFQSGLASLNDVQDIADGGAGERGHNPNPLRVSWDGAFAFGGEESLGLELLL